MDRVMSAAQLSANLLRSEDPGGLLPTESPSGRAGHAIEWDGFSPAAVDESTLGEALSQCREMLLSAFESFRRGGADSAKGNFFGETLCAQCPLS
jgi:hypothetical protein